MENFNEVVQRLEGFIKKYYLNELIKGAILFVSVGVLYLIVIALLENFLWLSSTGRIVIFILFITVEVLLFIRFLGWPLLKLFRIRKGLSKEQASLIIGNHFPNVSDKLINVLQLHNSANRSALLLASIEQKATELRPIPFSKAIQFSSNKKYLKFLFLPLGVIILLLLVNRINWISNGYERIINYNVAYERPAPFKFIIANDSLTVHQDKDFTLVVSTVGTVAPQDVFITYNDETYLLQNKGDGTHEYTFVEPDQNISFALNANEVFSGDYVLQVVAVPSLLDFVMELEYPSYTSKANEVIKSSGNAVVPEGTKVLWKASTQNTTEMQLKANDSMYLFDRRGDNFKYEMRLFTNLNYELTTSNDQIAQYDKLGFAITTIKDQYPELFLRSQKDSTANEVIYHNGKVSDDYGLTKLQLVYYPVDTNIEKNRIQLPISKSGYDEFFYVFPDTISLKPGVAYEYFFEVFDNDVLHNYKSSKSQVFQYRKLTKDEEEVIRLNQQNSMISQLNKSLEKIKNTDENIDELNKLQKEKRTLNFEDRQKLKSFLQRQKSQEKMMEQFTKQLKKSLDEEDKDEPFKDALKERLERNEERLRKNQELLEELEELTDKLQKEELGEKLDELGKENKNIKRNLEQLLELTKRYYLSEKAQKIADQLEKLGNKQEELSEKQSKDSKEQEDINKAFDELKKELDELRQQNEDLRKPMDVLPEENLEKQVDEELQNIEDAEENNDSDSKRQSQKAAGQKMKQMSQAMGQQMQMAGQAQQMEDMQMLRQILDNLVDFSLEQEGLMKEVKSIGIDNPQYSQKLKKQSVLRENFIHIDDSLYALAMRTPQITDKVTETLTDVEFNIDKTLERLAENRVIQGTANQQYVVTGANELAFLLSNVLDQMQNSMSSSGKGKSGQNEFQLPDIIQKQEQLEGQMKDGMKPKEGGQKEGKEPNGQEGSKQQKGKGEQNGKEGKDGKQGQSGKDDGDKKGGSKNEKLNTEEENEALFEIFKEQQKLRNELEERIKQEGLDNKLGSQILKEMERVEQELLENGINENTLERMANLKHQLIKLQEATLKQGEDNKRESESNKKEFEQQRIEQLKRAKEYFNTIEILNRQVLPLRQNYKEKVKEYFKDND
ncbi:DUF4175 family protein [Aquimarina brevivitae]|uniref:Glutamyl-tRNA synthetase n=1 Tax=Aquimarina brevivitae TaxID=323412 RepID=A0A4Q7PHQ6_9FLAO|nr:DUF4175 family protein [Aquimarina brevivitae]RZS99330.1 hypothetical protein EV197_0539 [Aquimarina brevivitae]